MSSSLETIEKYEKKLAEGIKKRNYRRFIEDESDDDEELEKKIKKYEHKISHAKVTLGSAVIPTATVVLTKDDSHIDKSGMSLLLFYAYVEPGWSSKQHTETIKWAEGVLSSNGVTGRLRVSREGFNGTLTGGGGGG
jgi:hypothetical protein